MVFARQYDRVTDLQHHARRAASFHSAADAYDAARPGYPAAALSWMVPDEARSILDLGAGTGKLTESLVAPGRQVFAVDPSSEMLRVLASKLPTVEARVGGGEDIPLPDMSVDAVTVAQAWHWMDRARAAAEIARVLRPGGILSLVWNNDDDRVPWVRELGGVDAEETPRVRPAADGDAEPIEGFHAGEAAGFEWVRRLTREEFIAYECSVSAFLVAREEEQRARVAYLHEVLERHPEIVHDGHIAYPVFTFVLRYCRT
ncbi:class I SAM-dependent methyltransferase [Gryllotalpicola reticulitermitis]|uniref:Class I SAM-dependent methyltransferase n=1 Tax=Gryllotalpicola reticulitermitis TaxID=1184153 RepID=A0ABV8Q5C9_9MICO